VAERLPDITVGAGNILNHCCPVKD
jgi:hypothetical protein